MSKYTELKSKHQAEVNAFPFGFAFNDKQFADTLPRFEVGGRWFDDIVDNNIRRQGDC